jgi:hypothetical protein
LGSFAKKLNIGTYIGGATFKFLKLSNELVDKLLPQPNLFIVFLRLLDLAKHILYTHRIPVNIHVDVGTGYVEHCDHLLHIIGDLESVDVPGWLKRIAPFLCPPRVLEIVPSSLEDGGVNGPSVAMAREYARLAHTKNVDEVALTDAKEQRSKPDLIGLRYPEALVTVQGQNTRYNMVFEDVREWFASIRESFCIGLHGGSYFEL